MIQPLLQNLRPQCLRGIKVFRDDKTIAVLQYWCVSCHSHQLQLTFLSTIYDSELLAKLSFMNSLLSSELKTYIQITNKGDELVT